MIAIDVLANNQLIPALIAASLYFLTYVSFVHLLRYWRNWYPPTRSSSLITAGLALATIAHVSISPDGWSLLALVLATGFIACLFGIIAAPAIAFEPGAPRPVVEFRKWLSAEFDFCGESVGFFKFSAEIAEQIMLQTDLSLRQGRRNEPYEETIRDVLLTSPRGTFAFEDITGMPWIEIDFAVDMERANSEILPRISKAIDDRSLASMIVENKNASLVLAS
jgi:hypothetical protein